MPMQLNRNVVISLWVALVVLATIVAPPVNLVFSLFLLVLGLAVPVMVYVLWHDPPMTASLVAQRTDAARRHR